LKKYLKKDFDLSKMIDVFDELPFWSAPFGLKLLDAIDYRANITALDIGFGTGFPLTEIAMRLGDSSVVYGIDPWKDTFKRVRRKIECYGIANIRLIEGVAESIPLEDNSIDLISSNNGLNNVSHIDKALSECSRIMKKGGQFVQTMNTDLTMIEFYRVFEHVMRDFHLDKEIRLMHEHIAQKRPAVDGYIRKIQKSGFMIKNLEHGQFNYRFADGTTLLNHYFIRLAFMESWIQLLPPERVEEIFDQIEKRLNEQSVKAGGVKLSIPFVLINAIKE
jgi:arsenite methyltransferase